MGNNNNHTPKARCARHFNTLYANSFTLHISLGIDIIIVKILQKKLRPDIYLSQKAPHNCSNLTNLPQLGFVLSSVFHVNTEGVSSTIFYVLIFCLSLR
jgi:hypothetical protein